MVWELVCNNSPHYENIRKKRAGLCLAVHKLNGKGKGKNSP
jgi:hypothetical protein